MSTRNLQIRGKKVAALALTGTLVLLTGPKQANAKPVIKTEPLSYNKAVDNTDIFELDPAILPEDPTEGLFQDKKRKKRR